MRTTVKNLGLTVAIYLSLLPFGGAAFAADVGKPAPDFSLTAYSGKKFQLSEMKGKTVVLEWYNPGCPFVRHHYESKNMQKIQQEAKGKGAVWVTINSTAADHKDYLKADDAARLMSQYDMQSDYILPDADGSVGRLYGAKTTPHMFVIDKEGKLIYAGAIDDNSEVSGDKSTAKNYVREAVNESLAGKPVAVAETAPYGCSVKYAS